MPTIRIYGYARVSTKDQRLDRQIQDLVNAGVHQMNIFTDKASGKDFDRESYIKLVGNDEVEPLLEEGDRLIISSIDRLGRNYTEIQEQWKRITQDIGADVKVLDMPLLDTTAADGTLDSRFIADLVLQILSYVAAKERENTRRRQAQGIALAKKRGVYSGSNWAGAPREVMSADEFETLYQQYKAGETTVKEMAEVFDVSLGTVYNRIRERKEIGKSYDPNTPRASQTTAQAT